MTLLASFCLLASLSSSDALVIVLNSPNATSPERYAEACAMVSDEAKAGKPLQQFVYGAVICAYKDESGKYIDASKGKIKILAEKRDNPLAWYLLSLERNDVHLLKRAAEGGNVQALNAYGTILLQSAMDRNLSSNRVEQIAATSFECFRKATIQNDANAFINLGACYLRGFGCEMDLAMAHNCFKRAAEAGHPEGMDYLSASYELGHGIEKNSEAAVFWMMKAKATRGDAAAKEWLKK